MEKEMRKALKRGLTMIIMGILGVFWVLYVIAENPKENVGYLVVMGAISGVLLFSGIATIAVAIATQSD
jgi:uncharacterized membrane protein HdeD (DUF308 family)